MEENKYESKRDSSKTILILLLLLILGIAAYLFYSNSKKSGEINVKDEKIKTGEDSLNAKVKELEDLQSAYLIIKKERALLGLNNDSLNKEIAKINDYIIAVKSKNINKINQLNSIIAKAKSDITLKDAEITKLEDSLKLTLSKIPPVDTSVVSVHKAHLKSLEEKIQIASVLKAEDIKVSIINKKGKELYKEEYNLKIIKKLKVSFVLAENKVAQPGNRTLLMRIVEPSGAPIYEGSYNTNGKDVPYTVKKTVSFENDSQRVFFLYETTKPFSPGDHTVEIYENGNLIGTGQFAVW